MPSTVQANNLAQLHRLRRQRRGKSRLGGSAGLGCAAAVSLLLALSGIFLTLAYIQVTRDLPSLDRLPALLEPPNGLLLQPTRLYDRSGEQLLYTLESASTPQREAFAVASLASGGSQPIFSSPLISATLATADPNFYQHPGYSLGGIPQGSSPTLAQRLVSDLLLQDEPASLVRSLRERLLAAQITARFGRDQVLEWYLNSAAYGEQVYGAGAAARFYFAKSASQITLGEAAFLAAAAQDPALNPWKDQQLATRRRDLVIGKMISQGLISATQAEQARSRPLAFQASDPIATTSVPAFAHLVLQQLQSSIPLENLLRGGYRVITTLDATLQSQAVCTSQIQLERLSSSQRTTPPGASCPAAQLLPTLSASPSSLTATLSAEVVILEPSSGQILALAGEPRPGLDPASLPGHPPGTLVTPFIYLTAFSKGLSPATLAWDVPGSQPGSEAQNFDGQFHGPMRLRTALANDYLPPAESLLSELGPETVWQTAVQMGIRSLASVRPQGSLRQVAEQGSLTLLEAVQAFGVLGNQGTLVGRETQPDSATGNLEPVAVLKVEDAFGQNVVVDWSQGRSGKLSSRAVIGTQLAYLVTHILSDETARWPSLGHPNALEVGRPAAVKVGRTFAGNDNWAVGATPQLAIGVWVGSSSGLAPSVVNPAAASGVWHALLQFSHRDLPVEAWQAPGGLSHLEVCSLSGQLPTPFCPATVMEVFIDGTEPAHTDSLFRSVAINRETGNQATIFTPSDLIEEKVFLVVPPEAAEWARQSGYDLPPASFDSLPASLPVIPGVQINSPAMLAPVSGKVMISGSAMGEDFDFFRVQVGAGLNPKEWLQLGEDNTKPVASGRLATWDTAGLEGVYAIQLLVVRKDKQVQTTAVLVTVDNQPPEIHIDYPPEGEKLPARPGEWITFRVSLADSQPLQIVEFFVDGQRIATRVEPPFNIPWQAVKGRHRLVVKATDQAGNQSEASATFLVP